MPFEVIYYPFVRFNNNRTLKNSVIYFDKIHIIRPPSLKIRKGSNEYILQKEGLLEYIDPFDTINKYQEIFDYLVELDADHFERFYQDNVYADYLWLYDRKISRLMTSRMFEEEHIDEIYSGIADRYNNQIRIPFPIAMSILMNHVYFVTTQFGYTPFTDSSRDEVFLRIKFEREAMNINNPRYQQKLSQLDVQIRKDLFAQRVLNEFLPTLGDIGIRKILDIKDDYKSDLRRFRNEMARLSRQINVDYWDINIDGEMNRIIDEQIRPSINNLTTNIDNAKADLKAKYGKRAITGSVCVIGTLISGGLATVPLITLMGGVISTSISARNAIQTANDYIDYLKDKRIAYNNNSMSYLFQFK